MQTLRLIREQNGTVIGDRIVRADTTLLRLAGLLGKKHLPLGAGVWLQPSSGVHTFGMRFSIDVLGLDAQLRVVKLWASLPPQRITSIDFRVKSVVELAPGAIDTYGIKIDDQFKLLPNHSASSENRQKWAWYPPRWS